MELVDRFMNLFSGNTRSYGQWNPNTGGMITIIKEPTREVYFNHVEGRTGLGAVPIRDDGTCFFAAIDIDNHDGEEIDHIALEKKIRNMELPLVLCKSKSGGAHVYLFGNEPLDAKLTRSIMAKWANDLGYSGAEIFPKQYYLRFDHDGNRTLGNWLNLPYFRENDTDRYAIIDGQYSNFDYFLINAENKKVEMSELEKLYSDNHPDAPPCIQKMLTNGVSHGYRNEALYNLTVYLRKAFSDNARDMAFDFNQKIFDRPLAHSEANKTISSASRRNYQYRCKEEPLKGFCDRAICLNRNFGISKSDAEDLDAANNIPEFSELKKYTTDPVKWELTVDGVPIFLNTTTLMCFPKVREKIADELTRLIPQIKGKDWDKILQRLISNAHIIYTPDDASSSGIIRSKLYEFMERADLDSNGENTDDREALFRGQPVVQKFKDDDTRYVIFRGPDFVEHLKRTKSEELKGANLWFALKKAGVQHGRLRVKDKIINVWYVKADEKNIKLSDIDFDPGF